MAISSKRVESLLSEARVAIKNAGESPWIDKKFYIAQVGAWSPRPLFLFLSTRNRRGKQRSCNRGDPGNFSIF